MLSRMISVTFSGMGVGDVFFMMAMRLLAIFEPCASPVIVSGFYAQLDQHIPSLSSGI
jgi:hypothetical protein